jgi:hypothetical protein
LLLEDDLKEEDMGEKYITHDENEKLFQKFFRRPQRKETS